LSGAISVCASMASSKTQTDKPGHGPGSVVSDGGGALTPRGLQVQLVDRFRLRPDAPLKLAYSGGLDSEVLLHLLAGLHRQTGWPVSAIHVDHGLSRNAQAWVAHCTARCHVLGIPLAVERVQLATRKEEGVEGAARRVRYEALRGHIGPGEVLLTAQHQRDQAETLLLRLLRGTGCRGMGAMVPEVRFGGGRLLRPLLEIPRNLVEDYARRHGLTWLDDEMNRDPALARGFLRELVMPTMRRFWPSADAQLARAANNAAEAAALLDEVAQGDLVHCRTATAGALSVSALLGLSLLRRKNALRLWFVRQGRPRPSSRHLGQVLKAIEQKTSTARAIVREHDAEVRRYRDQLFLAVASTNVSSQSWCASWDPDHPLVLPDNAGTLRAVIDHGRGLSRNRLGGRSLDVRFRRGGEVCRLPGRNHHHKVKKLLQEAGIPPWERETLPLIYVDNELAAVGPHWVCVPYAATVGEPSLRLVIDRDVN